MAGRGPARTPTTILNQRDSWRGKQRASSEPKPTGKLTMPNWLSKDARTVWRQVVRAWSSVPGLLTPADSNALARYCETFVAWKKNNTFCQERGEHYPLRDDNGDIKCLQLWPQATQRNKQALLLLRMEQEFGMTPAARARIQLNIEPPSSGSDKSQFFSQGLKVVG